MATPNMTSDMAQFFDFGEAAVPEVSEQEAGNALAAFTKQGQCLAHGSDGCLCHDPQEQIVLQEGLVDGTSQPEWNPDFSSWIPRYHKPAQPCEYCRSKSLECFIFYNARGVAVSGCSPCNALFRPCSFSEPEKMPLRMSKTALDTLNVVNEQTECCIGGLTGRKQMRSLGHVGPIEDEDTGGPKKGAAAARFPRASIKILKDWMLEHIDHPYPTDEDKDELKGQTGLTISQITNWMANTRRRQKARPKRTSSPSIRPSTGAIDIPAGRTWDDLNPFERWKHSPPENEPAPMTAIAQAVENFDLPEPSSLSSSYRKGNSNDSTSFSAFRSPSTASLETGFTNVSSGSHNSAWSHGSRNSRSSWGSLNIKERRRRRRLPTRTPKADLDAAPRPFQCTFCCDRFKNKYDWSRHEKSLHLSLEKWICAPLGDVITTLASGQRKCVFCDTIDPSKEHLEAHQHRTCEEKGLEARTFYRKDHLRQHLRLMHGCKMTPSMESWKAEVQVINSRCGFCGFTFTKWQDRVDHLAKEFRNGASMKDWKGCRGLDPHVAAHVVNAMPPYLIANESKSPFPFSASNSSSMKHIHLDLEQTDLEYLMPGDRSAAPNSRKDMFISYNAIMDSSLSPTSLQNMSACTSPRAHPNATCWEVLTLRLGRFARQYIEKYGADTITDTLLQQKSREILYESDDPWNQTAADNPEWLNLFKKAHGIENTETRAWKHQDILEDLGIRSSAQLDPSFNLNNFLSIDQAPITQADLSDFHITSQSSHHADALALSYECSLTGTLNMSRAVQQASSSPTSLAALTSTPHSTPNPSNHLPTTFLDLSNPLETPTSTHLPSPNLDPQNTLLPATTTTTTTPTTPSLHNPFSLQPWAPHIPTPLTTTVPTPPSTTTAGINTSNPNHNISSFSTMTSQAWDDSELDFALDMDMDLDMDLDLDMHLGGSGGNGGADIDVDGLEDLLLGLGGTGV